MTNPPAIRQFQQQQQQQPPQKLPPPKILPSPTENRIEPETSSSKPSVSSSLSLSGNLRAVLGVSYSDRSRSIFPKMSVSGWRNCDDSELNPYFCLRDLWQSFWEWSACGAEVPLVLNGSDCVVQYYVPYLSGIQLSVDSSRSILRFRRPDEENDGEPYLDTSSGGSSESEAERLISERAFLGSSTIGMGLEDSLSDDGEVCNHPILPIFEYLERDPPYGRER